MSVVKKGSRIILSIGRERYCYDESSRPLGEGAMGIVFLGTNMNTGKPVAIKRVRSNYANIPAIRRRAHTEGDFMFSHDNLVEMYGCCEDVSGRGPVFLVSGFVQGENIDTFIKQRIRNLPNVERHICNIFMPVLDALGFLHAKGIIHLDIKPSNIMVERNRNVRLMDLGIAVDSMDTAIMSEMMGTPRYAAPEQFANSGYEKGPTFSADIYEAGVTLYELITQKNPFPGTVDEAREMHKTLILPDDPSISESVLAVIRKATDVNPLKRYQDASQMKYDLQNALMSKQKPKPFYVRFWWCAAAIAGIIIGLLITLTL